MFKSFSTSNDNLSLSIQFPEKGVLLVKGKNTNTVLHLIESLLAYDFTGNLVNDSVPFKYEGVSSLVFDTGVLTGQDKMVFAEGEVPKIHSIRYLELSNSIRSFLLGNDEAGSLISNQTIKKTSAISDEIWVRIVQTLNKIFRYTALSIQNSELIFSFKEQYELSEDIQKIMFLMLSECYLTPEGYNRLIILPNMDGVNKSVLSKFIYQLLLTSGKTTIMTSADLQLSDFSLMVPVGILTA